MGQSLVIYKLNENYGFKKAIIKIEEKLNLEKRSLRLEK